MSGVVVVTANHDGRDHGMTVSAISSLSMEPPILVACLNTRSETSRLVEGSRQFAVKILSEDQGSLAEHFAKPAEDKFAGVPHRRGHHGAPVLADALAVVECHVVESVRGGTHAVFLARATRAEAHEGSPLAYFRGRFGRFELAQDDAVLEEVRRLIVSRGVHPGETVAPEDLVTRLEAPTSSVHYALTRLLGENLVRRDPEKGYVVVPLEAVTSDDAHDAQLAIELGAAELTVGRLPVERVARLQQLAEATSALIVDEQILEVESCVAKNAAFHSYIVRASGIAALARAYESLSLPELMMRALVAPVPASGQLVEDHFDLVEAYEDGDLPKARRVIVAHNAHAKATQRLGIDRAGGSI